MDPIHAITLTQAKHFIQSGRVVAFPTGTTYGLAADVSQGFALQRVRNLKRRPTEKTFTVFLTPSLYNQYFKLNPSDQQALAILVEQPVTVLLEPRSNLIHLAQDGLVGLRLIDHSLMRQLADITQLPLTATSANQSGQPACLSPACFSQQFPREVASHAYDLSLAGYLDAGTLPSSKPSTIIRLKHLGYEIVRPGSLTALQLDALLLSQQSS
jgi:L-threonylcarbamoyladenylate synthase